MKTLSLPPAIALLLSSIFRTLGQLVLLVVFARVLHPEEFGAYTLAMAIASPIFVAAQLNLRAVFLTLRPSQAYKSFIVAQTGTVTVALLVTLIVGGFTELEILPLVVICAIVKALDAFIELFAALLQKYSRYDQILIGSVGIGLLGTVAATVVIWFTTSIYLAVLSLVGVTLIISAFAFVLPTRAFPAAEWPPGALVTKDEQWRILRAGTPMGISAALLSLVSFAPQYFLAAYFDKAVSAHFAILIYTYAIADLTMASIAQAAVPKYLNSPQTISAFLKRDIAVWTGCFALGSVIGLIIATPVIPAVFGEAYSLQSDTYIPIAISIILLPAAHMTGISLFVRNLYGKFFLVNLAATAAAVILGLILIPSFQVAGGFYMLGASLAVRIAGSLLILKKVNDV